MYVSLNYVYDYLNRVRGLQLSAYDCLTRVSELQLSVYERLKYVSEKKYYECVLMLEL